MKPHDANPPRRPRMGLSLIELMAVVSITGILAAIAIVRMADYSSTADQNACYLNQGEIAVQAQRWFRDKGTWPTAAMTVFGADTEYFPDGQLPQCPAGGTYTFDPATGEVTCSHHP